MAQIRWENIPEKTQTLSCPKLIKLLQCDKYFLKKMKICPLGDLIHAHHGTKMRFEIPSTSNQKSY